MMCPERRVDYQVLTTTYEQFGVMLKDVKAVRCPIDGEELFDARLEQVEAIR